MMRANKLILGLMMAAALPGSAQTNILKQTNVIALGGNKASTDDDELPMQTVLRDTPLFHTQGALASFSQLKAGEKVQILKVKSKRVQVRYYKNGRPIEDWIALANGYVEGLEDEESKHEMDPKIRTSTNSSGAKIDSVVVGMTRNQVIQIRGKPGFASTNTYAHTEILVYSANNIAQYIETTGYDQFGRPLRKTRTIPYLSSRTSVTLVDGIVTEVKRESFKAPGLGGSGTLVK